MPRAAVAALLLSCVAACRASSLVRSDVEFWSELDVSVKCSDSLALTVFGVDRSSVQLNNPQLGGVGVVVDFRANSLLTLSLGYIYAGLPNTGKGYSVDAPLAAASLARAFGRWSFRERSRGERLYAIPQNPYRYRQKVEVGYRVLRRLNVFANDEVFYQFGIDRWNQNRAQLGLNRVLNEALSIDLFYLQRNTSSEPKTTKGLGATVHIFIVHRKGKPT